jgi:hypothetical protein
MQRAVESAGSGLQEPMGESIKNRGALARLG